MNTQVYRERRPGYGVGVRTTLVHDAFETADSIRQLPLYKQILDALGPEESLTVYLEYQAQMQC